MLRDGHWTGRGSILADGQSRGQPVECEVDVLRDEKGVTVTGQWRQAERNDRDVSVRVAGNEVGTYTLAVRLNGETLQGTAKLDSPPNLGLLWNDAGSVHATFALFEVAGGFGFRGFVRDGTRVFTWEMAMSMRPGPAHGGNVVSLPRRRR